MKIEKGKFYRTTLGNKAEVYAVYPSVIHGVIHKGVDDHILTSWSPQGTSTSSEHLCSVWKEQHPAEYWSQGSIVEVSSNERSWCLRRFCYYDPVRSPPFVTLSDIGEGLIRWKYGRLPK